MMLKITARFSGRFAHKRVSFSDSYWVQPFQQKGDEKRRGKPIVRYGKSFAPDIKRRRDWAFAVQRLRRV
jgi:hypothetical protein